MIKISIIIPAYNVEKYISRCINSALHQTLKEIEVIVVNDGSTDKTKDIVENIAKQDSRVKVINIENAGVSNARNIGIKESTGDFIQFLDSDDWIEENMSYDMYTFAINNRCDLVVSNLYRDDDNSNLEIWIDLENVNLLDSSDYIELFFKQKAQSSVWNKIYKRYIFDNIYFPDNISLGEDFVVTIEASLKKIVIGKIDKAYYHYIINPNSITEDGKSKKFYQLFDAYDLVEKKLREANVYSKNSQGFNSKKFKDYSAFIHQKPYLKDKDYIKSFNRFMEYIKSQPKVDKESNIYKRILMRYLIIFPNSLNVKLTIKVVSSFKKFIKSI